MNKRSKGIDFLKCICCYMVVCVHTKEYAQTWEYVIIICQIAVPCFFMITGYFYDDVVNAGKGKKQIKKIAGLVVWSNVLYFIYNAFWAIRDNNFFIWLKNYFAPGEIISRKLLQGAVVSGHLWYLSALLIALLIIYFANKIKKNMYVLIPLLYLAGVLLGKYSFLFNGEIYSIVWSRNFLFTGLPFFLLGNLIRKKENAVIMIKIVKYRYILLATTILMLFLEKGIINEYNSNGDMFIFTGIVAVIFFITIKNTHSSFGNVLKMFTHIGRDYSTYIYIFHFMILSIISIIIEKLDIARNNLLFEFTVATICFLISLLVSAMIRWVITHKRKRKLK